MPRLHDHTLEEILNFDYKVEMLFINFQIKLFRYQGRNMHR